MCAFYDQRRSAPDSPAALRDEYDADLRVILERVGLETATAETSLDADRLEAVAAGDSPTLSLEDAAEIQSLAEGEPDSETGVEIACEHLLLGMTSAVLDVEALASEVDLDLDAKEIQQKLERRAPMSFGEFVHVQYAIADSMP